MASKKTPIKKPPPDAPTEVGWTLRMPADLADRIRERAAALTAKGRGKWTGNMVMLDALKTAAETWDSDDGAES